MAATTSSAGSEGSRLDLDDFLRVLESWVTARGLQDISSGISHMHVKEQSVQPQPVTETKVSAALLNFWSVNNKLAKFKKLIVDKELDVFLLTETWLTKRNEDNFIAKAQSQNFSVYHKMREHKGGGGVAIVVSNHLKSESVEFNQKPSENETENPFEFVAAELKHQPWAEPVLLINVYRPPDGNFQDFLKEFQEILDQATKRHRKLIVTGDFNIWVDDETDAKNREFQSLLDNNDLVQHVDEPTHKKGHTLDLVISRKDTVSDVNVNNDEISDHYTIYFKITGDKRKQNRK